MILPPGFQGAAFGQAADRMDRRPGLREVSRRLGIPAEWAILRQVHGTAVVRAAGPGPLGDGDAAFTTEGDLPLGVSTADCYPVIVEGVGGAGIAHAGWRGVAAGVVAALVEAMVAGGVTPRRAAIGPGIGPCCFEVGAEVAERFPEWRTTTTWGTTSVDLRRGLAASLRGLDLWVSEDCTMCGTGYHSHRRDGTSRRQMAVAWLPV